jgi:hypothetical protein
MITGRGLAMIALLMAAGACSLGSTGAEPRSAGPADIILPIDSYALTGVEMADLLRARELLVAECLREAGRSFDLPEALASPEGSARKEVADFGLHGNARRYGIVTMEHADRYGYHLTSGAPQQPSMKKPDIDNVEQRCADQATSDIAEGGPFGDAELVRKIDARSFEDAIADPKVRNAFGRWSDCMKAIGHHGVTPTDVSARFDLTTPGPTADEIATARADVSCKQETGLVDVWRDVDAARQQEWITRHADELRKIKEDRDALMRRVVDILSRSSLSPR